MNRRKSLIFVKIHDFELKICCFWAQNCSKQPKIARFWIGNFPNIFGKILFMISDVMWARRSDKSSKIVDFLRKSIISSPKSAVFEPKIARFWVGKFLNIFEKIFCWFLMWFTTYISSYLLYIVKYANLQAFLGCFEQF